MISMSLVQIKLKGENRVQIRMRGLRRKLKRGKPLFRKISDALLNEYTRNMTKGVDANQKKLATTQRWTRRLRADVGERVASGSVPLVATGGLRASMGPKQLRDSSLIFGFHGKFADIAEAMSFGKPGRIRVKKKSIRTTQSGPNKGKQYARIKTNSGQFFTKRVNGGFVSVKPQARHFFFLSRRQQKLIEKVTNKYIETALR